MHTPLLNTRLPMLIHPSYPGSHPPPPPSPCLSHEPTVPSSQAGHAAVIPSHETAFLRLFPPEGILAGDPAFSIPRLHKLHSGAAGGGRWATDTASAHRPQRQAAPAIAGALQAVSGVAAGLCRAEEPHAGLCRLQLFRCPFSKACTACRAAHFDWHTWPKTKPKFPGLDEPSLTLWFAVHGLLGFTHRPQLQQRSAPCAAPFLSSFQRPFWSFCTAPG